MVGLRVAGKLGLIGFKLSLFLALLALNWV